MNRERVRPTVQRKRSRELEAERAVSMFCLTILLSIALGLVVGGGLARAVFCPAEGP